MNLFFHLIYHTNPGEHIFIKGIASEDIPMEYNSFDSWVAFIQDVATTRQITYSYYVVYPDGSRRSEGALHTFTELPARDILVFYDRWNDYAYAHVFKTHPIEKRRFSGLVAVQTSCTVAAPDHYVALVGNTPQTGHWDPECALKMTHIGEGLWTVNLNYAQLSEGNTSLEYKYILRSHADPTFVEWEEGENRLLQIAENVYQAENKSVFVNFEDSPFRSTRPGTRYAGVAIPVFSLRSRKSWGIGDFMDLKKMADWCVKAGQRVLQILPVNDTTMYHNWIDSYPYGGISIMALHPLFLSIPAMCPPEYAPLLKPLERRRAQLNKGDVVDYDATAALKDQAYQILFKAMKKSVMQSQEYQTFFQENKEWLEPYAVFCVLRDKFHTADFRQWGPYAVYNPAFIEKVKGTSYHYFIQFFLDKQLREVRQYINKKGLILKGDIPIGITPKSVEAWTEPHLFKMDSQAGAPPDAFSVRGQNWGFPTYNWDVMARDGFSWWKKRFAQMARYFDAYRIDHILGFFRIWSIPQDQTQGLLGHFDPALPLSAQDITDYGMAFDYDRLLRPYITDFTLQELFGDQKQQVITHFLEPEALGGLYRLRPAFDTQRKISEYFDKLPHTEESTHLMDGLLALVAEVLFVPDPQQEGMYHPRISAQFTGSYKSLLATDKFAFNKLYDNYFFHRHNEFWGQQAMQKLPPLLASNQMLCCAEDLGMIPSCVPTVMAQLAILSLEVQRMPKDPSCDFGQPATYPFMSVCTTGSHDTSTLREWWEEDRNMSGRYYHDILHQGGPAPYFCEPYLCSMVVQAHLDAPSMLCILPWQDWMALSDSLRRQDPRQERINIPAIVPHYWRYRMHMTIEALLKAQAFNESLRQMVAAAGRVV